MDTTKYRREKQVEGLPAENKTDKTMILPKGKSVSTLLRENAMLKEYLSNGFNGTQAVKTTYPNIAKDHTAHAMSTEILRRPSIQDKLQRIIEAQDVHIEEHIAVLSDIANGSHIRTIETETTNAEGDVVARKIVREAPGPRDIATAINLIAKLTGTYDSLKIHATIATKEAKRLYDGIDRDIAKARRVATDAIVQAEGDAEGLEADGLGGKAPVCTYEHLPSATRQKKSKVKGHTDVEELPVSDGDGSAGTREEGSVVEEASIEVGEAE